MLNIHNIIRQMTANAKAIKALVETVSEEQSQWKPGPDAWSLSDVMSHVFNEERCDFRPHIKGLFIDPSKPWETYNERWIVAKDYRKALESFVQERKASIAWLKTLDSPDWDVTSRMTFGPNNVEMMLSAGELLVSWVEHDYLHIRQINELLHGWNAQQAAPYSVDYAGGW